MNKKDLHIVFGFTGEAILHQSQQINKEQGDILRFNDSLSLGPLGNLDKNKGIDNRMLWLKKIPGYIEFKDDSNYINIDLTKIKALVKNINNYKRIYLWLGNEADEKIITARLLYHLQGLSIPIFKPDFSKAEFKNIKGESINISSLLQMKEGDILKLWKHFEELNERDKQSFTSLWERLTKEESVIHLFDKESNYISRDESFFDQYLLNRCSIQDKKSSLVVAYTLYDVWEDWGYGGIGDAFLFYRLNILEKERKIKITNRDEAPERGHRLFDVRKA
jgi:hypothetical protein